MSMTIYRRGSEWHGTLDLQLLDHPGIGWFYVEVTAQGSDPLEVAEVLHQKADQLRADWDSRRRP